MLDSVSQIAQFWDRVLIKIKERLDEPQIFDSFFADSFIFDIKANTIIISVQSKAGVMLMKNKYSDLISEIINELSETNYIVDFGQYDELVASKSTEEVKKEPQNYFPFSQLNPNLTFDNFIEGDCNKEARLSALMIASNPGKMFKQLFIYSNSGLGKTHLLHAIGNYISKVSKPGAKVLFIDGNEFVEEYIKQIREQNDAEKLKDYITSFDVLLFDDIQFLANKTKTQEMFFTVYNKLLSAGKQIVITSDRQPNELSGIESRVLTRFMADLTVNIKDPDQKTCVEILKSLIVSNGLDLNNFDDAVIYFLADKFSHDLRELQGAFKRLIFYVVELKKTDKITMEVAAEALGALIGGNGADLQLSEQKIINVVADYYNLAPNQLMGKIRTGQISLARHIAMYLIRVSLDVSLEKIGDMFGGKHHTTVASGIEKVDKMLKTSPEVRQSLDELKKKLNL